MNEDRVRVAFTMLRSDHEELRREAEATSASLSAYMRKALVTHRYICERINSGAKILVETDGVQREVVFR